MSEACTSIVVSGRASADGRPFIFKNCDAKNYEVCVTIDGGKGCYKFLALVSSKTIKHNRVTCGFNEAGFAIINTNTHNQNGDKQDHAENNRLMYRALKICTTINDFEHMLDTLPRPMHLNTCYGVMDGKGAVAIIEAHNLGYVKYDANDSTIAPTGWIVRTNYALSGDLNNIVGKKRYDTMCEFANTNAKDGRIDYRDIIYEATRYGSIPTRVTADAKLIQGVKNDENPLGTIAWTACGSPLVIPVIPLWITPDGFLPRMVKAAPGCKPSPLASMSIAKRKRLSSPIKRDFVDLLRPVENEIHSKANKAIKSQRRQKCKSKVVEKFYIWLDRYLSQI